MPWCLWECSKCGATLKINKIVDEKEYERIKECSCEDGELQYKADVEE